MSYSRILVIRRDNIGDLLCTTPLFTALRNHFPDAWIGVLTNHYNGPILAGNPDISEFFAYRKAKHRSAGENRLAIWGETAALLWRLRRKKLDLVLCASVGGYRFARLLAAQRIIELNHSDSGHEVAITWQLLASLGITGTPGPLVLQPDTQRRDEMRQIFGLKGEGRCIALHLSARKPRQRWQVERFAELARHLLADGIANRILLFWAPGGENDPLHPGDDQKALQLMGLLGGLPVTPIPTHELADLVAGLSLADSVICSDGGAMHIAAALGKPIVCFFGNSSAERWHPWGVPYELLQKPSQDVADISVDEAYAAFLRLQDRVAELNAPRPS